MKQHVKHSMSLLSVVCYFSLALKLSGDFSLKPRPAVQCLMLCRCGLGPSRTSYLLYTSTKLHRRTDQYNVKGAAILEDHFFPPTVQFDTTPPPRRPRLPEIEADSSGSWKFLS